MSEYSGTYGQKAKHTRFIVHVIVLVFVFVLPEVIMSWGHTIPKFVYVHMIGYILAFYVNYFLLIDRFLFVRNRVWRFFVYNLLLIICYLSFMFIVHILGYPPEFMAGKNDAMPPLPPSKEEWMVWWLHGVGTRDFLMMVLSICISVALKFSEKWVKWEQYEQKMVAEQMEMELKNLKNQLNPHFLFNTLNNIYALIYIDRDRAQYAVHELSQLLRYVLYDNDSPTVMLDKDMLFVKNYIELMRLRLNDSVKLDVDIDESQGAGLQIAPLMFISLVENAFKHGVSGNEKSVIYISIKVENGWVVCNVANSYFPKDKSDKSGSGIGIANLKRRLSILYKGRYTMVQGVEDGLYKTRLEINLQNE